MGRAARATVRSNVTPVIVDLLVEHTVLLYSLYIAIGAVLGQIRITARPHRAGRRPFSALAISAIDERLALPEIVGQIGSWSHRSLRVAGGEQRTHVLDTLRT